MNTESPRDVFAGLAWALRDELRGAQRADPPDVCHDPTVREWLDGANAATTGRGGEPAATDATRHGLRNRLMDRCSSDHRPLVELVLRTGRELHDALTTSSGTPAAEKVAVSRWEDRRAPIVHRLIATHYLQTDIARWLVDTWAFALGVRDEMPTSPSIQMLAVESRSEAEPTVGQTRSRLWPGATPRHGHPISRAGVARQTMGAGVAAPRHAPRSSSTRSRMSPAELARIKRMERMGLLLLAGAAAFSFAAHGYAMWAKPLERERGADQRGADQRGADQRATGDTATVVASATRRSPTTRSMLRTVNASSPAADRPPQVASINAARPARISTANDAATVTASGASTTVAGRYRVSHVATSVTGGERCDEVAGALAQQQSSVETIEQDPGSSSIRLVSRGVRGRVRADGQFRIGPDSGTTDGVRWTFVMQGRFTPAGFVAESQKTTVAIVRWRVVRSCAVVADLRGVRLSE